MSNEETDIMKSDRIKTVMTAIRLMIQIIGYCNTLRSMPSLYLLLDGKLLTY